MHTAPAVIAREVNDTARCTEGRPPHLALKENKLGRACWLALVKSGQTVRTQNNINTICVRYPFQRGGVGGVFSNGSSTRLCVVGDRDLEHTARRLEPVRPDRVPDINKEPCNKRRAAVNSAIRTFDPVCWSARAMHPMGRACKQANENKCGC